MTKVTKTLSNISITETRDNRTERVFERGRIRGRAVSFREPTSERVWGCEPRGRQWDRFTRGLISLKTKLY